MATKAEQEWMDAITRLGCIACIVSKGAYGTPAEVHHIISHGRRVGHLSTIPLCHRHHGAGLLTDQFVSRHPWRSRFESTYGSEWTLLEKTRELVREHITNAA